ncbi:MAG: aminotransferase class IV [Bacteroidota bacterium]
MSRFFETVCIKNGIPQYLEWHERRMNLARREFFGEVRPILLEEAISLSGAMLTGVFRCNIHYDEEVKQVSYKKYEKRVIRSLKLVYDPDIDYHLKFTDRSVLESLFKLRGPFDEVVIVKNGFITDTTVSNLIFLSGNTWFTPATPLLEGTCRNRLLYEGRITARNIRVKDLNLFTDCKLINAMRDPDEESAIPVSAII